MGFSLAVAGVDFGLAAACLLGLCMQAKGEQPPVTTSEELDWKRCMFEAAVPHVMANVGWC